MLLRIAFENHLSICKRQELSFAASSLLDPTDGLIKCDAVHRGAVVPAVMIFGANASGKTNFINALSTMTGMVLWSQTKSGPGGGVLRHKYMLDPSCSEKPSCFEIDFMLDGVRYHYGFEATDEAFTSEWLYEIPKAHHRKLYERKEQDFTFGRQLKGQNNAIAKLTRPNSLFLSAAAQTGHELLSRLYEYFENIVFSGPIYVQGHSVPRRVKKDGVDSRVIDFLQSINTGVVGYRKKKRELSEEDQEKHREFRTAFERIFGPLLNDADTEERMVRIELTHSGKDGEEVPFALGWESAGTRRLLIILSEIFKAIDEGLTVVIDEIDASLHTCVGETILGLFCSPTINQNGAQLIATTHDTNLMKAPVLRRDQIWFADKSIEGATEIYPLTDFRTRRQDNVELGDLQGRYGAVPHGDPVAELVADLEAKLVA